MRSLQFTVMHSQQTYLFWYAVAIPHWVLLFQTHFPISAARNTVYPALGCKACGLLPQ